MQLVPDCTSPIVSPTKESLDYNWRYVLLPSATVVAERLCFHRCLSVHRRGGVHPWPGRHPPSLLGRQKARQTPPGRRPLERTVRILLECILISCNLLGVLLKYTPKWEQFASFSLKAFSIDCLCATTVRKVLFWWWQQQECKQNCVVEV